MTIDEAKEVLEDFNFDCEIDGDKLIVSRGDEKIETLSAPFLESHISFLLENAGF